MITLNLKKSATASTRQPIRSLSDDDITDTELGRPRSPDNHMSYDSFLQLNDLISSPQPDEKHAYPEGGTEGEHPCLPCGGHTTVSERLLKANHRIREGGRETVSVIKQLEAFITDYPENPDCREDLFEEKYFAHLLIAVGLFKLKQPEMAEAALTEAQVTSEKFRRQSREKNNTAAIQLKHFARLGKLLSVYLQDEDLELAGDSKQFKGIWQMRSIEAQAPENLQYLSFSGFYFHLFPAPFASTRAPQKPPSEVSKIPAKILV